MYAKFWWQWRSGPIAKTCIRRYDYNREVIRVNECVHLQHQFQTLLPFMKCALAPLLMLIYVYNQIHLEEEKYLNKRLQEL